MENHQDVLHSVADAAAVAANETVGKIASEFLEYARSLLTWENLY